MKPTETYFATLAGVIATLLVALVFGWVRPRRPLGRFAVIYAIVMWFMVGISLTTAFDGMTESPVIPGTWSAYLGIATIGMLLGAIVVALAVRVESDHQTP